METIEARLPDGRTLQFPEGTEDAIIDSTVKKELGVVDKPIETPEKPVTETPVMDVPKEAPEFKLSTSEKIDIFSEVFMENLKEKGVEAARSMFNPESRELAFIMGGATAGGLVGVPMGLPGIAGGSSLGAMAGKALDDALFDKKPLSVDLIKGILKEGIYELGGLKVADVFTGKLLDTGLRKLYGVDDATKYLSEASLRQKINLGIVDIGNQIARGVKTVLGVFPFVATPFRQATELQQKQATKALADKLDMIAPHSVVSDLGVDMTKSARKTYEEFRSITGALYDNADNVARGLSEKDIVPTSHFKSIVSDLKKGVEPVYTVEGKPVLGPTNKELDEYIEGLNQLPDNITVGQLRTIQKDISTFFDQAQVQGYDTVKLARLKKASDEAMLNLDISKLPKEEADQVLQAYKLANDTFFEGMKHFETSTAKKFTRVNKNIFSPGKYKAGSLNEDEIVKAVFNSGSPQAIRDLKSLVGTHNVSVAARKHISAAFQSSMRVDKDTGVLVFNPTKAKNALGLTEMSEDKMAALEEMLSGTRQTAADLKEFLDVAEQIGEVVVAAKMVKRRYVLGGMNALIRSFTLGSIGAAGTITIPHTLFVSVPLMYLFRRTGRFLNDPQSLKNLTMIMDDTTPDKIRRQLAVRMLRLSLSGESQNTIVEDMAYKPKTTYPFME